MKHPRFALACAALAACACSWPMTGAAQQRWPTKPIRILTSTPGGPYDVIMRGLGGPLGEALGQPIVVENRTGGSFIPLADACAHATPDGHTLCTSDSFAQSLNPLLFRICPTTPRRISPRSSSSERSTRAC